MSVKFKNFHVRAHQGTKNTMPNENLNAAKKAKNDEFYTQLADIEREMNAYLAVDPDVFRGKVVLLPCDNPQWSNFTKYFADNFTRLGLKELISTGFSPPVVAVDADGNEVSTAQRGVILRAKSQAAAKRNRWKHLKADGDFRSAEVKALRDEADFVITNPPFSLFREFVAWLVEGDVRFSVIGPVIAITYKNLFPLIKDNKVWLGTNYKVDGGAMFYEVPESVVHLKKVIEVRKDKDGNKQYIARVQGVRWYTNIEHGKRPKPLKLMTMADNIKHGAKWIKGKSYPKYDNYDAIEVSRVESIPSDYDGVMGVPISFLDKYCPEQFEILGSRRWAKSAALADVYCGDKTAETDFKTLINGRETYDRIFIKLKDTQS